MQKLRYHIICLLLLFLVGCAAKNKLNQDEKLDKLFSEGTQVEGPFSIEQIEKDNMIKVEKDGKSVVLAFGYINNDWEALKAQYQDGDKIYKFSSAEETWENLMGRAGYVLVRNNQIIAEIITLMN